MEKNSLKQLQVKLQEVTVLGQEIVPPCQRHIRPDVLDVH